MTRKEEINEQAFVNGFNDHDKEIFTIGAEWADSRPRKGLWDSKKVIEWLKSDPRFNYEILKDLRKAMEE